MGTTLLIALVHEDHAYLAHVGDSRIYLRRGGVVYQLTDDHSILNELLRQGRVTEESFADSPFARFKNALARAVGPAHGGRGHARLRVGPRRHAAHV